MVFLSSSVLVVVPSGDWVTVFSLVLTVPSLLVELLVSLDTWRSHPTRSNDNAKTDIAPQVAMICFFMAASYAMGWRMNMG